jgi:PAS domain S-box-containing protein
MPDHSLADLSFLFDNNPNPMWIFEIASFRILKVNRAATERYGYSEMEFLAMSTRDLRPNEELEKFNTYHQQRNASRSNHQSITHAGVWKHQNKNGELIYAEITCQDVKFENRDCTTVVATDVTEKMRYQEELIWTKNSLEALINNTEDQIWSVDKETRYVYMNKAYRTQISGLTGAEPKEGDYSYLHGGYGAEMIEKWKHYYNRALKGERYTIVNESIDPQTQQLLSFEISFNPIYKTKGDITGIGCFARNITGLLKTEKAIVDQNERLRNIASLTSHELRRPVASMLGLINIMDRDNFYNPDNKEIIEHLLTVGNEIDEVIRLIVDKTFMNDASDKKYQSP